MGPIPSVGSGCCLFCLFVFCDIPRALALGWGGSGGGGKCHRSMKVKRRKKETKEETKKGAGGTKS